MIITKVTKKISRASAIIAKIRHFLNRNALKLIYYALVYPYFTYGNLIWGETYKIRIQKIMNIQKNIVRLMMFKSYMEHTEMVFKELGILDIFKINDYLTGMFMFQYHRKNLPEQFSNYFVCVGQILKHNTRNSSKLYKRYKRTNYVKQTLSQKGIDICNSLQSDIKDINSCTAFKKQFKWHLLLNQT